MFQVNQVLKRKQDREVNRICGNWATKNKNKKNSRQPPDSRPYSRSYSRPIAARIAAPPFPPTPTNNTYLWLLIVADHIDVSKPQTLFTLAASFDVSRDFSLLGDLSIVVTGFCVRSVATMLVDTKPGCHVLDTKPGCHAGTNVTPMKYTNKATNCTLINIPPI